jgi:hypothetical protein
MMKNFWPVGLVLVAALAIAPAAKADSYSFAINGTGSTVLSGTGVITVSSGVITGGTFTFTNAGTGIAATGSLVTVSGSTGTVYYDDYTTGTITAAGPSSADDDYSRFDNTLTATASPYVDEYGILIALSNGAYLDIYSLDGVDYWGEYDGGTWIPAESDETVSLTIASTPEPSSLLLLGTGLLSLAGLLFWKAKPKMAKAA